MATKQKHADNTAWSRTEAVAKCHAPAGVAGSRLSVADQWSKLNLIVAKAIEGAEHAVACQGSAAQQIDLAHYGFATLQDELAAVMLIPGRRERPAKVYAFGATSTGIGTHALAA